MTNEQARLIGSSIVFLASAVFTGLGCVADYVSSGNDFPPEAIQFFGIILMSLTGVLFLFEYVQSVRRERRQKPLQPDAKPR